MFFKLFHRCKFEEIPNTMSLTGFVTLGWDYKPKREYLIKVICKKCGKEKTEDGFVVFGDNPNKSSDGWPLDDNQKRMPAKLSQRINVKRCD